MPMRCVSACASSGQPSGCASLLALSQSPKEVLRLGASPGFAQDGIQSRSTVHWYSSNSAASWRRRAFNRRLELRPLRTAPQATLESTTITNLHAPLCGIDFPVRLIVEKSALTSWKFIYRAFRNLKLATSFHTLP